MWLIKQILENPLKISIQRSINNFFLEKKNNNNSKIWYMSIVKNTSLWKYTTIKNENIIINSEIWDYSYISHASNITFTKIWKFCSIWQNFKSGLWKHPTNFVSTHPMFFSTWKQCQVTFADKNYYQERLKIEIWNDVWIWTNVIILDWINVWDWAIIWAWSVVTKDVEPYSIVWWIPAKIIKYRFNKEQIDFLLKFKWWDKNIKWIEENFIDFHNIDNFIEKFNK